MFDGIIKRSRLYKEMERKLEECCAESEYNEELIEQQQEHIRALESDAVQKRQELSVMTKVTAYLLTHPCLMGKDAKGIYVRVMAKDLEACSGKKVSVTSDCFPANAFRIGVEE